MLLVSQRKIALWRPYLSCRLLGVAIALESKAVDCYDQHVHTVAIGELSGVWC